MIDINKFTNDFVAEWNGRTLNINGANINFDGRYGTQCMDLWNYWWTELGLPVAGFPRHVDAATVWEDFKGKHYEYFDGIFPNRPAKKGDVFIYNRSAWQNGGTNGPGHIGIVISDNGDGTITVLETNGLGDGYEDDYMNQYGSPARIHTWPKTNLYGYLRLINKDDDFLAKLTDVEQQELLKKVRFIYSELQPITTGSKLKPVMVRFRDFYVQNIRAIQAQIDKLDVPRKK
jgi:hypothetical protein